MSFLCASICFFLDWLWDSVMDSGPTRLPNVVQTKWGGGDGSPPEWGADNSATVDFSTSYVSIWRCIITKNHQTTFLPLPYFLIWVPFLSDCCFSLIWYWFTITMATKMNSWTELQSSWNISLLWLQVYRINFLLSTF